MSMGMAYAMKKRRAKMAEGGKVGGYIEEEKASGYEDHRGSEPILDHAAMLEDDRRLNQHGEIEEGPYGARMAEGGFIGSHQSEDHDMDMVGRIMAQRQRMFSKGGQVANDVGIAEADKKPAEYDDLVLRDDDMEEADYTGKNSGDEIGNEGEDERRKDIVSRIMKSRAKKDRMPSPA